MQNIENTVPESAKLTVDYFIDIWNRAGIPTTYHPHIVSKLRRTGDEYNLIKNNKGRGLVMMHRKLEAGFVNKVSKLFDIAHKVKDMSKFAYENYNMTRYMVKVIYCLKISMNLFTCA